MANNEKLVGIMFDVTDDGPCEPVIACIEPGYKSIQHALGDRLFDVIGLPCQVVPDWQEVDLFVDDEGLIDGALANRYLRYHRSLGPIDVNQVIHGRFLALGCDTRTGETTSLPREAIRDVLEMVKDKAPAPELALIGFSAERTPDFILDAQAASLAKAYDEAHAAPSPATADEVRRRNARQLEKGNDLDRDGVVEVAEGDERHPGVVDETALRKEMEDAVATNEADRKANALVRDERER